MAVKVTLRSGSVLDAEKVTVEEYVVRLHDRNGDVMDNVGQPLVDSIESV